MSDTPRFDPMAALIRRAAEGDRKAVRQLVTALTPIIRTSVSAVLSRSGSPGRREGRQEVEDATQSVLVALFVDRARVLLQWDPDRGLALENFVSLLARRETVSLLRSRRRSPWTEDPTLHEDLDRNAVARMGPESETISRDMLANLEIAVRSKLSPRGAEIFDLMFMRGLPLDDVCAATGHSPDAVYAWKSRITRQVKEILAELASGPPSGVPIQPPRIGDSNPGLRDPTLEHTMVRLRKSVAGEREREQATPPLGISKTRAPAAPRSTPSAPSVRASVPRTGGRESGTGPGSDPSPAAPPLPAPRRRGGAAG